MYGTHIGHGVVRQDFPVAFWRKTGDYAFLRWESRIGEKVYAQPERDRGDEPTHTLSPDVTPPIVGRTYALQRGGDVLILRILPQFDRRWDAVSDGWRFLVPSVKPEVMLEATSEVTPTPHASAWSQIILPYPEGKAALVFAEPGRANRAILTQDADGSLNWRCEKLPAAFPAAQWVLLWGYSASGPVTTAPVFTKTKVLPAIPRTDEEQVRDLVWAWPGTTWRVRIDPVAETPLLERA